MDSKREPIEAIRRALVIKGGLDSSFPSRRARDDAQDVVVGSRDPGDVVGKSVCIRRYVQL